MKRLLSLLLCLAMIGSLCACAGTAQPRIDTTTEEASEYLNSQDGQVFLYGLSEKYDTDAIVMKAGDLDIPWGFYYQYIAQSLSQFLYNYGVLPTDYSMEIEAGVTMDREICMGAEEYAQLMAAIRAHSPLSDGEREEKFQEYWTLLLEQSGSEEALLEQLALEGYTPSVFRFFNLAQYDLEALQTELYGAGGENLSEDMINQWVADNGFVCAKHILLMTTDETLTQADKDAKKQQLEELRQELLAIEDNEEREAAFTEKMNALSEDGGLFMYPDGYVFQSGKMVKEFEDAAFVLENYDISEVVETSYGYHLLLGLPVKADGIIDFDSSYMPITVASEVASQDFSNKLQEWKEEVEVSYTPEFEGFTIQNLFVNYQDVINTYTAILSGEGNMDKGKIRIYPFGECQVADTTDSAVIDAARYYESGHLILTIAGKEEVFSHVPASLWEQFQASDAKGTFYKKYLKGNVNYRIPGVPAGKDFTPIVVE